MEEWRLLCSVTPLQSCRDEKKKEQIQSVRERWKNISIDYNLTNENLHASGSDLRGIRLACTYVKAKK